LSLWGSIHAHHARDIECPLSKLRDVFLVVPRSTPASGRFDPFGAPSGSDRYLRYSGRMRRFADI
jgi:hypothetical protein